MKKLTTLLFVLVFASSMAIAQNNDATVDQIGDDHEATITQTGQMNSAYVEQTADEGREGDDVGEATVIQDGEENYVDLRQRSFHGNSEASITQLGTGNSIHGQTEGDAFLQNHGLNILDVTMEGNDNTLYSMAGEAQKNVNTFLLDILGNDNSVGMKQHMGYADVGIEGDLNTVTLDQHASPVDTEHSAYIDILGDNNAVDVGQKGTAHTANVDVNGNWNSATITQN